jgi:L-seryl-tRNA(Ser) seleniumtransferase
MKSALQILQLLPSVQMVLEKLSPDQITSLKHDIVVMVIRQELDILREQLLQGNCRITSKAQGLELILQKVQRGLNQLLHLPLKKVINATGIVLHTGLGRAPLGRQLFHDFAELLDGYVNLEFNLETGERGERLDLTQELLVLVTGADSTVVVNNNAAAVLLALNSLAEHTEVIVSRGELIEIGGSFRLPDVMEKSGARMVEVGTTNRTYLQDYQKAFNSATGAILLAHTSNYSIVGFTAAPDSKELITWAHSQNVPVIMDLGSGALFNPDEVQLPGEVQVREAVAAGFDLVTFSGDKLLGGPQAGIIVGKKAAIEAVRHNPLMRAFRCDKLLLAVLSWTLQKYIFESEVPDIAALRLLTAKQETLLVAADKILAEIRPSIPDSVEIKVEKTLTEAGSGSMPTATLPSAAMVIRSENMAEGVMVKMLRQCKTPVVGYCKQQAVYIDLKAIPEEDYSRLIDSLREFLCNS